VIELKNVQAFFLLSRMEYLSNESWATMSERTQSSEHIAVTQGSLSYVGCVNTLLVEDSKSRIYQVIVLNPLPIVVFLAFDPFQHSFPIEYKIHEVCIFF
jgi:hypothetical protein